MDAEPHPKWLVLSEVLAEIHREYAKEEEELFTVPKKDSIESKLEDMFNSKSSKENSMEEDKEDPADILILTRDERNCSQLQTVGESFKSLKKETYVNTTLVYYLLS